MHNRRSTTLICVLLLSATAFGSTGCLKWFSAKVASGIGRLTMRNAGAVLQIVSDDKNCGFASDAAVNSAFVEGAVGSHGTVTWHVEECQIGLNSRQIARDCNEVATTVKGSFTITATKTVYGRLTGDPETPVIPEGPYAAKFDFEKVTFDKFKVHQSGNKNVLTINSGTLSGILQPKLAAAESNGACAIATPNVTFQDINLSNAEVDVRSPDRDFEAEVDSSLMSAQSGVRADQENTLSGTMTVWGKTEDVPRDGDNDGLDPEYDAVDFVKGYHCTDDLRLPITSSCDLTPTLAMGAARLSIRTLAAVAAATNDDTQCGFSSDTSASSVVAHGTVGDPGGEAVFPALECALNFATETVLQTDCYGNEITVRGKALVTGTKTVAGYITGDRDAPAVPTSWDPAVIAISADLTDFQVKDGNSDKWLTVHSGELSGTIEPRTALDDATDVCSISTPVARISNVGWQDGDATMTASGFDFRVSIESAFLEAVNGPRDGLENYLAGSITVDGTQVVVPSDDQILNPEYNASVFAGSYGCEEGVTIPTSTAECAFTPALAVSAARLLVKSFGIIGKRADEDVACGFAGIDGIIPSDLGGDIFGEVIADWSIEACRLSGIANPLLVGTDCSGTRTYIEGRADVSATKTVAGVIALSYPPIQPTHREAAHVTTHGVALNDFVIKEYAPGSSQPEAYMRILSGNLSGVTFPITGEAASTPGAFFIKTPVAGFETVRIVNADVEIFAEGKQFNLHIDESLLTAFNGSYLYKTNQLSGEITVDGKPYRIPTEGTGTLELNPDYEQQAFDAAYVCEDDLRETVPAGR